MADILDAAVVVFSREGIERATTNGIAAEAGISPGSLYQFYRDKADILGALGRRYAEDLTEVHRRAIDGVDLTARPMPEVLDRIIDPIVAFKNAHSAFLPLFARPDLPGTLRDPLTSVDREFEGTITTLLDQRNPDAEPEVARTAAAVMITVVRAMLGMLGAATGDPDADLAELKLCLLGYLDRKGLR